MVRIRREEMKILLSTLLLFSMVCFAEAQKLQSNTGDGTCTKPIIYADVPDMSMLRVGDTYYMTSPTIHMSPGVPVMKSKDLVNWKLVNYAYDVLDTIDALTLNNGQSTYSRGSWASCIRYNKGTYYVTTFAQTTGKTYIYTTKDIEKGSTKTRIKP